MQTPPKGTMRLYICFALSCKTYGNLVQSNKILTYSPTRVVFSPVFFKFKLYSPNSSVHSWEIWNPFRLLHSSIEFSIICWLRYWNVFLPIGSSFLFVIFFLYLGIKSSRYYQDIPLNSVYLSLFCLTIPMTVFLKTPEPKSVWFYSQTLPIPPFSSQGWAKFLWKFWALKWYWDLIILHYSESILKFLWLLLLQ